MKFGDQKFSTFVWFESLLSVESLLTTVLKLDDRCRVVGMTCEGCDRVFVKARFSGTLMVGIARLMGNI